MGGHNDEQVVKAKGKDMGEGRQDEEADRYETVVRDAASNTARLRASHPFSLRVSRIQPVRDFCFSFLQVPNRVIWTSWLACLARLQLQKALRSPPSDCARSRPSRFLLVGLATGTSTPIRWLAEPRVRHESTGMCARGASDASQTQFRGKGL